MDKHHDDGERDEAAALIEEYENPVLALRQAMALLEEVFDGDKLYDPRSDDEHASREELDAQYDAMKERAQVIDQYRGHLVDEKIISGRVQSLYSANKNCKCCAGKGYPGHRHSILLVDKDGEPVDTQAEVTAALRDAEDGAYVTITILTGEDAP